MILLLFCSACTKRHNLPDDPGLLKEDFGCGVILGQTTSEVQTAIGNQPGGIEIRLVTPDELGSSNPYIDHDPDVDLVVPLYTAVPDDPSLASRDMDYDEVFEIRFYLAAPEHSKVTLFGNNLAGLYPEDLIDLLGQPASNILGMDGHQHLTFIFSNPEDRNTALKVVSSHFHDENCFAFLLTLEELQN